MLSVTEDLGPPPAYSPRDPQTPSSDASFQPDTPISPLRPSIRGGYLSIIHDPQEVPFSSAAAYFESRPYDIDVPIATILIEHKITPHTTQDDLPLQSLIPGHPSGLETRDVHPQDWATFVNYIISELNGSTSVRDQNSEKNVSREVFEERRQRIEAVVAEWNEGFFGPRRIRFVPEFSYAIPHRQSSPTPSYRTFLTTQGPQESISFGLPVPQPAFRGTPMTPPPNFGHHRQPEAQNPRMIAQPGGAPGRYPIPFNLFGTAGGRGWHWGGRGNNGGRRGRHRTGMDDGDSHRGHRRGGNGHRGRSTSTSSSSSDDHHGRRRRGKGHRARPSSTSSSSSDDHHGRRKGRHHRSSSTSSVSSSSSSSSNDSASSISSDELRGVEPTDIRQAIANFRLDPTRKQHVKQAVRQLRSELRSHRKSVSRGSAEQSKALRAETRSQKRLIKSEVKSLWKEAKQYKKGLKQQRRAEKRMIKAEKQARRRGRGQDVSSLETYPMSIPGSFPGQVSGSRDVEAGPRLSGLDQFSLNPGAGELRRGFGQDLSMGGGPRGLGGRQRLGVVLEARARTASGLRDVGVDTEEMRRRAGDADIQNQLAIKRQEELEKRQEKEARNQERQVEKQALRREKEVEFQGEEADKAAAQRMLEQARASKEREMDAARQRQDLEKDTVQRTRDQEMAAVERENIAFQRQRDLDRAVHVPGQWPTSQTVRQGTLIDNDAGLGTSRGFGRRPNNTTPNVNPGAPSGRSYFDRPGVRISQWGERFGRDAAVRGERFGRDAGVWGERFGRDMQAKFT
ncbi:hypothetical protein MMC11_008636 [Xylographa trunciseda]|nr:hypothetical protein [Xylographa trunciseda]